MLFEQIFEQLYKLLEMYFKLNPALVEKQRLSFEQSAAVLTAADAKIGAASNLNSTIHSSNAAQSTSTSNAAPASPKAVTLTVICQRIAYEVRNSVPPKKYENVMDMFRDERSTIMVVFRDPQNVNTRIPQVFLTPELALEYIKRVEREAQSIRPVVSVGRGGDLAILPAPNPHSAPISEGIDYLNRVIQERVANKIADEVRGTVLSTQFGGKEAQKIMLEKLAVDVTLSDPQNPGVKVKQTFITPELAKEFITKVAKDMQFVVSIEMKSGKKLEPYIPKLNHSSIKDAINYLNQVIAKKAVLASALRKLRILGIFGSQPSDETSAKPPTYFTVNGR